MIADYDRLAHNLRKIQNTFIVGQSGVGKTRIIQTYLKGLRTTPSNTCVISKEMDYQGLNVLEVNSLTSPSKIVDVLDEFCYPSCEGVDDPCYRDIIFDDFQVFLNDLESYRVLDDWISENMDEDIRFIFTAQQINWKMMPIINQCSTLYLGQNDEINIKRYKNFTRIENDKIYGFLVVNK